MKDTENERSATPTWTENDRRNHNDRLLRLEIEFAALKDSLTKHLHDEDADRKDLLAKMEQNRHEFYAEMDRSRRELANEIATARTTFFQALIEGQNEFRETLGRIETKQTSVTGFTAGAVFVIGALSAAIGSFWGKISFH